MWIHWPFFPKTWTKGHWPLDDLWPHVCWGHMFDSTQGSLCPSPMTIHQCMWIQWSILQITTYIHTHTTYILHTTYRMSDHIVSYWTQFRRDNYWTQFRRDKNLATNYHEHVKTKTFLFSWHGLAYQKRYLIIFGQCSAQPLIHNWWMVRATITQCSCVPSYVNWHVYMHITCCVSTQT